MDGKWTGNDVGEKRLMVPSSNNRPETHASQGETANSLTLVQVG